MNAFLALLFCLFYSFGTNVLPLSLFSRTVSSDCPSTWSTSPPKEKREHYQFRFGAKNEIKRGREAHCLTPIQMCDVNLTLSKHLPRILWQIKSLFSFWTEWSTFSPSVVESPALFPLFSSRCLYIFHFYSFSPSKNAPKLTHISTTTLLIQPTSTYNIRTSVLSIVPVEIAVLESVSCVIYREISPPSTHQNYLLPNQTKYIHLIGTSKR